MTKLELDLYYVVTNSYTIIWSQYLKRLQRKGLESYIWAKGNNSYKSRSSVTKLELDLYYVMANSYNKFEFNV